LNICGRLLEREKRGISSYDDDDDDDDGNTERDKNHVCSSWAPQLAKCIVEMLLNCNSG
jgi:hypothetical protein